MLYTLNPTLAENVSLRVLMILGFAFLTGLGANLSIPLHPVPITMQVLAVLLAGLLLGWRDGAASQFTYLGLIAVGLPLAADGVGGLIAFQRPSTGYLYAFPIAAALVGLLGSRQNALLRLLASSAGIAVIYLMGATYLKYNLDLSWNATWTAGVAPFLLVDAGKALLAALGGEAARQWWWPGQLPPNR
jgi:biotin transport system substrate-specific component